MAIAVCTVFGSGPVESKAFVEFHRVPVSKRKTAPWMVRLIVLRCDSKLDRGDEHPCHGTISPQVAEEIAVECRCCP